MAEMSLAEFTARKFQTTTDSNNEKPIAANVLDREFTARRPNEKWVTDLTYVWTAEGWLYVAAVIDLYSRRVVGWSTGESLETSLCLKALSMALGHRRRIKGLTHYLDRGVQYASDDYRKGLRARGIECSMSRRANCWDNAVAEGFFGTLKTELIYRRPWLTRESAREAIGEYVEVFYNRIRRQSTISNVSPAKFNESKLRKTG